MSHYNPDSKIPMWVKYVGLGILAVAAFSLTFYVLTMSSGPMIIPGSVSPNAK